MTLPNVDDLMFDLMLEAKRRKLARQRRSLDDATPEEWDALKRKRYGKIVEQCVNTVPLTQKAIEVPNESKSEYHKTDRHL